MGELLHLEGGSTEQCPETLAGPFLSIEGEGVRLRCSMSKGHRGAHRVQVFWPVESEEERREVASTQQDQPEVAIEQGGACEHCKGTGHDWEPGPSGEPISTGPCPECEGTGGVAAESDPGPAGADEEIAALTSPEGIRDLIHRFVQAGAPIAEDGGSNADIEAFNEVFVDACFVSHWLTGKEDCER